MKRPTSGRDTPGADGDAVPAPETALDSPPEEGIALAEETVRLDKRETVSATVRVRTVVDTVEESARASLKRGSVEVTRVPVNEVVDVAPDIRTDGDVTIVPILEEILVVEKRLLLKEELHVRRHESTEDVEVPVTLRKQRAIVERTDRDGETGEE